MKSYFIRGVVWQIGGFVWVLNELDIKKPIIHLYPFNKIGITQIQHNPIIQAKT